MLVLRSVSRSHFKRMHIGVCPGYCLRGELHIMPKGSNSLRVSISSMIYVISTPEYVRANVCLQTREADPHCAVCFLFGVTVRSTPRLLSPHVS